MVIAQKLLRFEILLHLECAESAKAYEHYEQEDDEVAAVADRVEEIVAEELLSPSAAYVSNKIAVIFFPSESILFYLLINLHRLISYQLVPPCE